MTEPDNNTRDTSASTRLYLRACIKILATIGFVFLLVPFFKSLPWPRDEIPVDSVLLRQTELAQGATRRIRLPGDAVVFVTRSSPDLQAALAAFDPDNLWFPSAPGLTEQRYFVVRATSMQDEALQYLPPKAAWPGGFVADSGAAWDVAGRALKPWPGHPSGYRMKIQNLLPMPFKARGDDVLLIPPADTPAPASEENP